MNSNVLAPLGRALFAAIFLVSAPNHFASTTVAYAAHEGVPFAAVLVPLSGLVMLAGGLSVLLGYKARAGAVLLALFLIPATILFHDFWAVEDPLMAQMQQVMFLKNVSMFGAALFIAHAGAGPLSLDSRRGRTVVPKLQEA
jgi:putative oxidoreductase